MSQFLLTPGGAIGKPALQLGNSLHSAGRPVRHRDPRGCDPLGAGIKPAHYARLLEQRCERRLAVTHVGTSIRARVVATIVSLLLVLAGVIRIDSRSPQRPHGMGIVLLVCALWIAALVPRARSTVRSERPRPRECWRCVRGRSGHSSSIPTTPPGSDRPTSRRAPPPTRASRGRTPSTSVKRVRVRARFTLLEGVLPRDALVGGRARRLGGRSEPGGAVGIDELCPLRPRTHCQHRPGRGPSLLTVGRARRHQGGDPQRAHEQDDAPAMRPLGTGRVDPHHAGKHQERHDGCYDTRAYGGSNVRYGKPPLTSLFEQPGIMSRFDASPQRVTTARILLTGLPFV